MNKLNLGRDLYLKGRIGWRGLSKEEYLEKSDYKIINASALMDGYVDWNNCGFISKERYEESAEIMLRENDILISKDGTLGKIGYVKGLTLPCTVSSGVFVLRNTLTDFLDFDYLYHVLKSNIFKSFISNNKALGSTISHLYQSDLENFELDLPKIEDQRKISRILNLIEDKINNNKSINEKLLETATLIFNFWFVQFDFPNKGKPYKTSGGEMVWNEKLKRNIPKYWKVGNLYEIADFVNGLACQKFRPKNDQEKLPVIKITEMHNGITSKSEWVQSNIQPKYIIENGDILFSWSASLETMIWNGGRGGLNQHIFKVIPKNIGREYVYVQLSTYIINFIMMAESRKTTMGHITTDHLNQSRIVIPPSEIIKEYCELTKDIFEKLTETSEETSSLLLLKEFLLPILVSGQLDIWKKTTIKN